MNNKLQLVADFYEFTMSNGYFLKNMNDKLSYFDVFFRKIPDENGYPDCKICATNSLDEHLISSLLKQEAKIKVSESAIKVTNPSFKKVYRFYDKDTKKALADVITLHDEVIPEDNYMIFDPQNPWKKKILTNYIVRPLQEKIFESGKLVYKSPTLKDIAKYAKKELDTLWDEVKRLENPHEYYVDLSKDLWTLKNNMLNNIYF